MNINSNNKNYNKNYNQNNNKEDNNSNYNEFNSWDELEIKNSLLRGIYSYGFENPSPIQKRLFFLLYQKMI